VLLVAYYKIMFVLLLLLLLLRYKTRQKNSNFQIVCII
jgi:hypothetical protein